MHKTLSSSNTSGILYELHLSGGLGKEKIVFDFINPVLWVGFRA